MTQTPTLTITRIEAGNYEVLINNITDGFISKQNGEWRYSPIRTMDSWKACATWTKREMVSHLQSSVANDSDWLKGAEQDTEMDAEMGWD